MASLVLAFDMDGVLFDTESVKKRAFLDSLAPLCADEAVLEQVDAYNSAQRGVSREEKIRHVLSEVLGLPPSRHGEVAGRYAGLLQRRLPDCLPIEGLPEFLVRVDATRYVVSSAPEAEVRGNLGRHGLAAAFHGVYGHPWAKAEALRAIAERHGGSGVVFFGDAPADLAAAREARVVFAAVNPNPGLAGLVQEHFDDFTGIDRDTVDNFRGESTPPDTAR